MCTDKLLSTFCSVFTIDKVFQNNENQEKENFLNNNKPLWELLSNLSLHTWHRFFNVETLELLVNKKSVNLEEEMRNFYTFDENMRSYNSFTGSSYSTKSKSECEKNSI